MIVEKSRDSTSVEDPGYSKFRSYNGLRSGQGGSTTVDYGPDMVARVDRYSAKTFERYRDSTREFASCSRRADEACGAGAYDYYLRLSTRCTVM